MNNLLKGKNPYIFITAISLLVYVRSFFFKYTYFDDNVLILDNLFFLKEIGNFFNAFTMEVFHVLHASAAYYRPMLTISFMMDAIFSGANPFLYHFTSVLIHIINSCLVYLTLKKIKISDDLSFILAAIFAVHPILIQGVSWLPGRNDSLLALFILPAFIFFIDYFEKQTNKYLIFHFIFFALALFTKESSLFLPAVLIFYAYLVFDKKILMGKIWSLLFGWIPIYILWFLLRSIALGSNPAPYTLGSAISAVFNNSPAVLLFLGKVFLPFNLSVLPTLQDSTLIYGVISLIILVLVLIFSKNKKMSIILFGLIWFLVFLLPSFVRPNTSYVADFLEHRIYTPLIGLFIILSEIDYLKKLKLDNKKVFWGFIAILSGLIIINFIHNTNFKDKLIFWKNAVAHSPSHPLAHKNLGAMYYLEGNLTEAEKEFRKSVELNTTEPMIHNNLGLIYFRRGEYDKAQQEFAKELELYPGYDNALFNWGLLYYTIGEKDKAAEMWLKTVQVNPDHKEALRNLAYYYTLDKKDKIKASYFVQEAVKRGVQF